MCVVSNPEHARVAAELSTRVGLGIHDAIRDGMASIHRLAGATDVQVRGVLVLAIASAAGDAIGVLLGQSAPEHRAQLLAVAVDAVAKCAGDARDDLLRRRAS